MPAGWVQWSPRPCFSAAQITKVVEDNHNSKVADALVAKQWLEKASAKVMDSAIDEIRTAHTPADMWIVEKISACISHERAKAYNALVEQYHPGFEPSKGKDDLGKGPGRIAKAEEEFCRSMTDLISTILTKGRKIPGGHGVALASNVLQLVPTLPLNLVLAPCIDLPLEKDCRIVSGKTPRSLPLSHSTPSSLPSLPLTGSTSGPASTTRSAIWFGQAVI